MSKNNQDKEDIPYTDFSNVETGRNFILPETLPEGPYGSPRGKHTPVVNKTTEWEEGQRYYSAFNYENKTLHQDIPRQDTFAHPTHDDPKQNEEPPYTENK
ncbi:cytosolic protein [Mangrovibacillus cuniculi]|uniref:Cytosolic protein n=1 Tax=Mangrovibacillus cuniculi TaxID=2593652 RepID=A0A7S8CCC7_9BACI|nr:cytosolic protein [Mangrovibacillus cuniculi]QPC47384.1 cytosolic protein [Mangrovibacillus cuniculi]